MNEELTKLLSDFNALQTDMRATLEKQSNEIRTNGESSSATAARVDALSAQLEELQLEMARPENRETAPQSFGAQFVGSDAYRDMLAQNSDRSQRVSVGSFYGLQTEGSPLVAPDRVGIVIPAGRELRLRDILDVQTTDSNAVEYVEQTGFVNNAAPRKEKVAAGQSEITYQSKSASVETINHFIPATSRILRDAGQLRGMIDNQLIYGLKVAEEGQILYGTGTSPQLSGIITNARVQTYDWSDGQVGDTKIDAIRRAITKATLAHYPVTGIVLNPQDWEDIELAKGSDAKYIWVTVSDGGVSRLWRVPVVETPAINAGESLVGAFGLGATLYDRLQASIRVSDSHSDFFIKNQVAILAEEEIALTVQRPEAFVAVNFDSAPVAP